jgi:predicted nucleic acid-binding protein
MLETTSSPVIFDHTVLNSFAFARGFDVIRRLYSGRAFICKAAWKEMQRKIGSSQRYQHLLEQARLEAIYRAVTEGCLQVVSDEVNPGDEITELQLAHEYSQSLCPRQAESMAIAHTRGWVFASDHPPVRNFARVRKIRLTGTLGILVKAAKRRILSVSEADSIHARIINHGYRSPLSPINGVSSFLNR